MAKKYISAAATYPISKRAGKLDHVVIGETAAGAITLYDAFLIGDSTTQFDISDQTGNVFRYTYDTTGTNPNISTSTLQAGQTISIQAQNFAAGNKGTFTITAVGANYFEVTNASGVAELNKTIGTGFIALGDITTLDTIGVLKSSIVEGTYEYEVSFTNGLTAVVAAASKLTVVYDSSC